MKLSNYDYVIFITTNNLIDGNDCTVYCHGLNQSICTEKTLDFLETVEHSDVIISSNKPKDVGKDNIFLSIEGKGMKYIWDCEENKMFLPCVHADLSKLSAYLFTNTLGVSSKEEFLKMLQKNTEY